MLVPTPDMVNFQANIHKETQELYNIILKLKAKEEPPAHKYPDRTIDLIKRSVLYPY
jgi:hypothetical protein